MFNYDVIVIGAGPAGSTFARVAPKNLKIAVVDKSDLSYERPKPCGGLLAPDAQRELAKDGLTLPKEILVSPQIFAVKTIDLKTDQTRHYVRSYLNMDRQRFDSWLRSLIPPSVTKINARCTSVERFGDGFKVTYKQENEVKEATCKYLLGADGANSIVRSAFFKKPIRKYIAIQRWYKGDKITPFYSCVFDKNTSKCCSWSISKDNYIIYGGAFAKKNSKEAFETQLETAKAKGFVLQDEILNEACTVCWPKTALEIVSGGRGVMLLGEAGGFISPSSLEGISWAMRCGHLAAEAFSCKDPIKAYCKKSKSLKFKLGLKTIKSWFMYNPVLRWLVLKTGIKSVKVN